MALTLAYPAAAPPDTSLPRDLLIANRSLRGAVSKLAEPEPWPIARDYGAAIEGGCE